MLTGGVFDRWDIQVRGGMLGAARCRMTVEEHGHGRQLIRMRMWPRPSGGALALAIGLAVLTTAAVLDGAAVVGAVLAVPAVALAMLCVRDCVYATGALVDGFREQSLVDARDEQSAVAVIAAEAHAAMPAHRAVTSITQGGPVLAKSRSEQAP